MSIREKLQKTYNCLMVQYEEKAAYARKLEKELDELKHQFLKNDSIRIHEEERKRKRSVDEESTSLIQQLQTDLEMERKKSARLQYQCEIYSDSLKSSIQREMELRTRRR